VATTFVKRCRDAGSGSPGARRAKASSGWREVESTRHGPPLTRNTLDTPRGVGRMRLECPQCVVRDWSLGDKDALVHVANSRAVWRNMTDMFPYPYGEVEADAWFSFLAGMPEPTHWVIEVDGRVAGGIGVEIGEGVFSRSANFGYWLGEPFWGRGIMTAAAQMVAPYAMAQFNLCRLEADVFEWNPASMRVLERCGFVREGVSAASVLKDGQVIDRVVYALVSRSGV